MKFNLTNKDESFQSQLFQKAKARVTFHPNVSFKYPDNQRKGLPMLIGSWHFPSKTPLPILNPSDSFSCDWYWFANRTGCRRTTDGEADPQKPAVIIGCFFYGRGSILLGHGHFLDQVPLVHYLEQYRVTFEDFEYGRPGARDGGIRIATFESIKWSTHLD